MMNIKGLYYITHIDNLPSIFSKGILSRERITTEGVRNKRIDQEELVKKRKKRFTADGNNLWYYVNLFIQPRNPMLFRVIDDYGKQNLVLLGISNSILQTEGIFFTDGIASATRTHIFPLSEGLQVLQTRADILQSDTWISWKNTDIDQRHLMAECLIPKQVEPEYIRRFLVANQSVADSLRGRLSDSFIQKLVIATEIGSNIFTPFS